MDEIKRLDRDAWRSELLQPGRLLQVSPGMLFLALAAQGMGAWFLFGALFVAMWVITSAYIDSRRRRFRRAHLGARWTECEDRLRRFEAVLKQLRRENVAELGEMPETIRRVGTSVYVALRKADVVLDEVSRSELNGPGPSRWDGATSDPQSQELYKLADRNLAEYRSELAAILSGVHRAEAQAAVFITTLDSLRVKMLGYRLVNRKPDIPADEFLSALAEARTQLQSIDKALDELDMGHYPKQIYAPEDLTQGT